MQGSLIYASEIAEGDRVILAHRPASVESVHGFMGYRRLFIRRDNSTLGGWFDVLPHVMVWRFPQDEEA